MQDPNVISRMRGGDGAALKAVFRSVAPKAYALAYRMTGRAETADEIVSAVFEELWHKRHDLDPLQDLTSTILRETYLCVRALSPAEETQGGLPSGSADPRLQPLLERLGHLTDVQRLAFLLIAAEGFSRREVARTLDISEDAVATLLGKTFQELEPIVEQPSL